MFYAIIAIAIPVAVLWALVVLARWGRATFLSKTEGVIDRRRQRIAASLCNRDHPPWFLQNQTLPKEGNCAGGRPIQIPHKTELRF